MQLSESKTYEVIVVGGGNAALCAALSAKESGADVLVLEKSPYDLRGGNTRYSGGIFRSCFEKLEDLKPFITDPEDLETIEADPYSPDDYLNDILRVTNGRTDTVLMGTVTQNSYDTLIWMAKQGVHWELSKGVGITKILGTNRIKLAWGAPVRGVHEGAGLSQRLFEIVEAREIPVSYETRAMSIQTDQNYRVTGLEVHTPEGKKMLKAGAVILAAGGFQASPEMRVAYIGPDWASVKVRGTPFDTGDMTRAALAIGAQAYGDWGGCHATPIDADAPAYGDIKLTDKTNRLSYPYSALINMNGKRFLDEGSDFQVYTYALYGKLILREPGATAFQIFDSTAFPLLEARYSTGQPVEANTMAELMDGIHARFGKRGFKKDVALQTIEEYNAACQDTTFVPSKLDGKRTAGLTPEKTNWSLRLEKPPFRAYPCTGGITFTFGGIRVNTEAEVINYLNRPLPGLYSTGEMLGGFFSGNYAAGAGLMRGSVFGRIAGRNATKFAKGS